MQTTNQNAPSLTIRRHDRPNERIHKRRHDFRLLLFLHAILQPLSEIIEQKQKHQVPRDHSRMDVESGEMKFDLILFLRGRGELFVRPVRTDKRREDVATYTRRPEGDMLAHSPSSTTNNRLRSKNVKIKSEDGGRSQRADMSGEISRSPKGTIYVLRQCITRCVQSYRVVVKIHPVTSLAETSKHNAATPISQLQKKKKRGTRKQK